MDIVDDQMEKPGRKVDEAAGRNEWLGRSDGDREEMSGQECFEDTAKDSKNKEQRLPFLLSSAQVFSSTLLFCYTSPPRELSWYSQHQLEEPSVLHIHTDQTQD